MDKPKPTAEPIYRTGRKGLSMTEYPLSERYAYAFKGLIQAVLPGISVEQRGGHTKVQFPMEYGQTIQMHDPLKFVDQQIEEVAQEIEAAQAKLEILHRVKKFLLDLNPDEVSLADISEDDGPLKQLVVKTQKGTPSL